MLSSHELTRAGDGAAPVARCRGCPVAPGPGAFLLLLRRADICTLPTPPGHLASPAPAPRSPSFPASEPRRGTGTVEQHERNLGTASGHASGTAADDANKKEDAGLGPVLSGVGEERIPQGAGRGGSAGPAGTWRSITFGSQASWRPVPTRASTLLQLPLLAPGAPEGGEVVGKPQQPRRSPGTAGWRPGSSGGGSEETRCADSVSRPSGP